MTTAAVLAGHGILRAPEVVELAHAAGLELACAAVLLEKESGGGRNVWGHDPVPTGGAYVKGVPVTRGSYAAYRAARSRGAAGPQGCGPCQLTLDAFQLQADRVGGCWDPGANMRIGFGILAGLIREHGVRDGFRRYNGSGPAAERYADAAVARLAHWRALLAGAPLPTEDEVTQDEMEALADVIWRRPVTNSEGVVVGADQVLTATEGRVRALQDAGHPLFTPASASGGAAPSVDVDALAEQVAAKVLEQLGKRLGVPVT